MKILIYSSNEENYFAKVHEACKTGLRALCDARCWGLGYPGYDENLASAVDIKNAVFGEEDIDLFFYASGLGEKILQQGFIVKDLDKLKCKKAVKLCDFWSEAECKKEKYTNFILNNNIDYIFSYFRAPFHLWKDMEIYDRLVWTPPCFDPHIFNDWQNKKIYDVGNLNAGIFNKGEFYADRYNIHQKLLKMEGIKYYYEKHPGYGYLPPDTPLIGKNFSEAINKCKIFITSGGNLYKNFAPKYVEIMASKSCLFATEPMDSDLIGLVDGVNYVKIDENNVVDKVEYYLVHEEERNRIADEGYKFAFKRYSCYAQANFIFDVDLEN
jgi:hypothetical protein